MSGHVDHSLFCTARRSSQEHRFVGHAHCWNEHCVSRSRLPCSLRGLAFTTGLPDAWRTPVLYGLNRRRLRFSIFHRVSGLTPDGRPINENTQFMIGSDTRKIAAIALLQAVEDGLIALDDTVADVRLRNALRRSAFEPSLTSWWYRSL